MMCIRLIFPDLVGRRRCRRAFAKIAKTHLLSRYASRRSFSLPSYFQIYFKSRKIRVISLAVSLSLNYQLY